MSKVYKTPVELVDKAGPDRASKLNALKFEDLKDEELLDHFIKSAGWGFSGKIKNGGFHFDGPDWEKSYNPMTRQQVINELNERKRIDLEDGGDWFEYLD